MRINTKSKFRYGFLDTVEQNIWIFAAFSITISAISIIWGLGLYTISLIGN